MAAEVRYSSDEIKQAYLLFHEPGYEQDIFIS
jgi:hypothetical protein